MDEYNPPILDSMIVQGVSRDSMMDVQSSDKMRYASEPVNCQINNYFILYGEKREVVDKDCIYSVFTFYLNKGTAFFEDDCYEIFYIKKLGIIGAVHKINTELSFEWEKYLLVNLKDKSGKSVINREKLEFLVSKSIE